MKYLIEYILGAEDMSEATSFAHEVLYLADKDVEQVTVKPMNSRIRTFDEPHDSVVE